MHCHAVSLAKLDVMIKEATVDANGESEQTLDLFTRLEERLKLLFKTTVPVMAVAVERLDMTDTEQIGAVTRQIAAGRSDPGFNFARPSADRRFVVDQSVSPLGARHGAAVASICVQRKVWPPQ